MNKKLIYKQFSKTARYFLGSSRKKGFGLMEVLISAVIIIIILSALVTIGRAALSNNEGLAQRAQAIYVAQEGLELVRQIRDSNWIDGVSETKWNTLNPISSPIAPTIPGNYGLADWGSSKWVLGSYTSGTTATIGGIVFTRKINISDATGLLPVATGSTSLSPYAMKVKSIVTWTYAGQNKSVELSEILTNWRPDY